MVLSAEERKKRKAEKDKKYYQKNKDKIAEYKKEYRKENKDKIKEYYNQNKDKRKEYQKTPQGIKSRIISNWKSFGLVHPDFDALYETYLQTESCNVCKKVFGDTFERCLDHDHETGLFRQILCRGCNTKDNWKKKI